MGATFSGMGPRPGFKFSSGMTWDGISHPGPTVSLLPAYCSSIRSSYTEKILCKYKIETYGVTKSKIPIRLLKSNS